MKPDKYKKKSTEPKGEHSKRAVRFVTMVSKFFPPKVMLEKTHERCGQEEILVVLYSLAVVKHEISIIAVDEAQHSRANHNHRSW